MNREVSLRIAEMSSLLGEMGFSFIIWELDKPVMSVTVKKHFSDGEAVTRNYPRYIFESMSKRQIEYEAEHILKLFENKNFDNKPIEWRVE